jgi:hypothetical protein
MRSARSGLFLITFAVAVAATGLAASTSAPSGSAPLARSAPAQLPPGGFPAGMPATPMPSIKGCSSAQGATLREAWRLAHFTTWRARRTVDWIESRPRAERAALWSRDFVAGDDWSASPRRWFGSYDRGHADFVRKALAKGDARFRKQGKHVEGIRTLRCGQPIARKRDAHTDVCPTTGGGRNSPPGAYHAPVGVIVTCPSFWNAVRNPFVSPTVRMWNAAGDLVHELFHWLSVDGRYVVDYHADGVGGHPDGYYYGIDKVTYLAEKKRSWATRNNDTYKFLARGLGSSEPLFTGNWGDKEAGVAGALFLDQTWAQLVARWGELGAQGQYLADIETYVRGGARRYSGLWRRGPGNGDLFQGTWQQFVAHWESVKRTQDLVDVEVFPSGGGLRYLGVYRHKPGPHVGDGGVLAGLSWSQLVDRWREFAPVAYLADVETYVSGGQRRYIGVWRAGTGTGSLLQRSSWSPFAEYKRSRNGIEQLIDFEQYVAGGRWHFIGVWRHEPGQGPLHRNWTRGDLVGKWNELLGEKTLLDIEEYSALPSRVP